MASFMERYVAGDHERVWDELVGLGDTVRAEPFRSDAIDVAHETMRRVKINVSLIISRLNEIGYEFAYKDRTSRVRSGWWGDSYPVFAPPAQDAAELIDALEKKLGLMPLSLRAWYEVVGEVNLIGTLDGWPDIDVLDPLVIASLPEMVLFVEDEYQDWLDESDPEEFPFTWDFAPDDLHKANVSGGPSYGIVYPSASADARMPHEWHNTTFVNYLRICFRWGGFPGFERVDESERPAAQLKFLTDGLLPI